LTAFQAKNARTHYQWNQVMTSESFAPKGISNDCRQTSTTMTGTANYSSLGFDDGKDNTSGSSLLRGQ